MEMKGESEEEEWGERRGSEANLTCGAVELSNKLQTWHSSSHTRTHTQHEFELRADKVQEQRQRECGRSGGGGGAVVLGEKRVANALNVAYLDIFRFTAYTYTPAHWHTHREWERRAHVLRQEAQLQCGTYANMQRLQHISNSNCEYCNKFLYWTSPVLATPPPSSLPTAPCHSATNRQASVAAAVKINGKIYARFRLSLLLPLPPPLPSAHLLFPLFPPSSHSFLLPSHSAPLCVFIMSDVLLPVLIDGCNVDEDTQDMQQQQWQQQQLQPARYSGMLSMVAG